MIIQVNAYICDKCQSTTSLSQQVTIYEDPVVGLPKGWMEICGDLVCPECLRTKYPQVLEEKNSTAGDPNA